MTIYYDSLLSWNISMLLSQLQLQYKYLKYMYFFLSYYHIGQYLRYIYFKPFFLALMYITADFERLWIYVNIFQKSPCRRLEPL